MKIGVSLPVREMRDDLGAIRSFAQLADELGYNHRMDGLQGAILEVKLRHLDDWNDRRRGAAARYRAGLVDLDMLRCG